jgi:DNA-directed RNA polymerase I, II, and III subunit RPABC1
METSIKIICEMISQRGYKISSENDTTIICVDQYLEKLVVFKIPVIKFNVDKFKEYTNILHSMEISNCIIVYIDSVTSLPKKLVENSLDLNIELFTQEELQYNITKHCLVPLHTRLNDKEKQYFIETYGTKFPVILSSDPISRFYAFKVGDIIKITKNYRGICISYRIVKK